VDFDFQVTTSTTEVNGEYTDLSISGTVGGQAITGFDPGYEGGDDVSSTYNSGFFDGVDGGGLSFLAGGVAYNIYSNGSALFSDGSAAPIDVVFSTDAPAPAPYEWNYSFEVGSVDFSFQVTTSAVSSNGEYTDLSISGAVGGQAITGFDAGYEEGDDLESLNQGFFDGVDVGGLSFFAGGVAYNIYDQAGALYEISSSIGGEFPATDVDFSTDALCYLRGTHILTPAGETPVETLQIGDLVVTLSRGVQPIRWIGTGKLMVPAGHRSPATPVIVRRGAIADNVPHRDLRLTKGHAIYIQGAFIPAEFLVNHRSIVWDDDAREVEFYHIELPSHEVMVAEGAPAESYRDEGNRWMFANANPGWDRPGTAPHAPVLTGGAKLDSIWRRLLDRAGPRPHQPITTDPDLHLLIDGARIDGRTQPDGSLLFRVPASPYPVAIASRAACQDELGRARDPRRLGVAIAELVLRRGNDQQVIGAEALAAYPGSHAYEASENCTWTDGALRLPAALFNHPATLQIRLRHTTHYPQVAPKAA
jgi:hypothetical protein